MTANITGIRKVCSETKQLNGRYYVQISYNTRTGELLTTDHVGNSYSTYRDADTIHVCNAHAPMTMQQIRDAVEHAIYERS